MKQAPLAARRVAALRLALLTWYRKNRRDYPWRRRRDGYAIWVAEVMLQQTRIAVVIPAYERFLATFPTLDALANAGEEAVLAQWSGLGYYSRARALHAAARLLVTRGQADLPREYAKLRELPGIGSYTAAAVLSIAHGQPHAAVDGNIVRVLSRLECLAAADSRGEPYATIAQQLLDPHAAGDWNQAVMELGQIVCLPKVPLCGQCPVRRFCRAYGSKQIDRFPERRARPARERVALELTIVRDAANNLLLERGVFRHLPHLWLPLTSRLRGAHALGELRHAIVHRDFRVQVYAKTISPSALHRLSKSTHGAERRVVSPEQLGGLGRSSLLMKALAKSRPE